MRLRCLPVVAVAVLGVAVTACGDEATAGSAGLATTLPSTQVTATSTVTASSEPSTTAGSGAPATSSTVGVPEVLQFSAPLVGGGTFDGASVAGTPLALWFWAPG